MTEATLSPEQRERYVENRIEQRRGILSEIDYYRRERADHLAAQRSDATRGFDSAILRALRCQIGGSSDSPGGVADRRKA